MTPIKVKVYFRYTNPVQYETKLFEFKDDKHYANWFTKQISDEKIRKIIKLDEL